MPQATATPSPAAPIALTPATFTLANGQIVTLTGTQTDNKLVGKLVVAAAAQPKLTNGAQNATFPFQIAGGEYGYTGTFTPPRGFDIAGVFGALGNFTMKGQLQTAAESGSYEFITNGVTDKDVIPTTQGPTPNVTNTLVPTTPGTQTPFTGSFDFVVTNEANSNFGFTSIKGEANGVYGVPGLATVRSDITAPQPNLPASVINLAAYPNIYNETFTNRSIGVYLFKGSVGANAAVIKAGDFRERFVGCVGARAMRRAKGQCRIS